MATIESRFTHDCDSCAFHGRLGKYDVYRHNDTIILRHGNDGPEYLSYPAAIIERHLPPDDPARIALAMTK